MARGSITWPPSRLANLRVAAAAGKTCDELADEFGVTPMAITKVTSKYKISVSRPRSRRPANGVDGWWRWLLYKMPRPGALV